MIEKKTNIKNNLNILKPKSEDDIIRDLSKLSQEEKNQKLIDASFYGYLDIVKILIEAGADVNTKNFFGYTPLLWASIYNHKEVVNLLIEAGADINAKNNYGYTALIYASGNNNKDIIDLLKDMGLRNKI